MRHTLVRAIAWTAVGFVVLFGLRLGYGYLDPRSPDRRVSGGGEGEGFELEKRNYASAKIQRGGDGALAIDQKYERIADVRASSTAFERDEAAMRAAANAHGGVVQLEQKRGLAGARRLHLAVGVPPDRFDAFVTAMREVGTITHLTVDKQDRTNDFKELAAKRAALDSTRAAMAALEARNGSVAEMIQLQDRLLELEREIQDLGVSLGDFDAVNELCTVKLTLTETKATVIAAPHIPVWRRARIAFEWTVPRYLQLCLIALAGALAALISVTLLERLGAIARLVRARPLPVAEVAYAPGAASAGAGGSGGERGAELGGGSRPIGG